MTTKIYNKPRLSEVQNTNNHASETQKYYNMK